MYAPVSSLGWDRSQNEPQDITPPPPPPPPPESHVGLRAAPRWRLREVPTSRAAVAGDREGGSASLQPAHTALLQRPQTEDHRRLKPAKSSKNGVCSYHAALFLSALFICVMWSLCWLLASLPWLTVWSPPGCCWQPVKQSRYKDTQTQRYKDTKTHRDIKPQRCKDTQTQRYKDTKTHWDIKKQRHSHKETLRHTLLSIIMSSHSSDENMRLQWKCVI